MNRITASTLTLMAGALLPLSAQAASLDGTQW